MINLNNQKKGQGCVNERNSDVICFVNEQYIVVFIYYGEKKIIYSFLSAKITKALNNNSFSLATSHVLLMGDLPRSVKTRYVMYKSALKTYI